MAFPGWRPYTRRLHSARMSRCRIPPHMSATWAFWWASRERRLIGQRVLNTGLCPDVTSIRRHRVREPAPTSSCRTMSRMPTRHRDGLRWGDFHLHDSVDSIVQYNFGHDSSAVPRSLPFIVRLGEQRFSYNVCSNDGQKDSLSYRARWLLAVVRLTVCRSTTTPSTGRAISAPYAIYSGTNYNSFGTT